MEIARRDSLRLSNIIEDLLAEWVKNKDPGNPQRPLTAYVLGHRDQETLLRKNLTVILKDLSNQYRKEIPFKRILEELKQRQVPSKKRYPMAHSIAGELHELGVKVIM